MKVQSPPAPAGISEGTKHSPGKKGIPCRGAASTRLQGSQERGTGVCWERWDWTSRCTWQSGARWNWSQGEVKALNVG